MMIKADFCQGDKTVNCHTRKPFFFTCNNKKMCCKAVLLLYSTSLQQNGMMLTYKRMQTVEKNLYRKH